MCYLKYFVHLRKLLYGHKRVAVGCLGVDLLLVRHTTVIITVHSFGVNKNLTGSMLFYHLQFSYDKKYLGWYRPV